MPRRPHPARLLSALELLQTRGRLSGAELAQKLKVERRTVRRYMTTLEAMGIPLTTERGRAGGYELVAGYRLPPLMLTDDEVVAVALGLAAVRGQGLPAEPHAVASAQAKLERVMPARLRSRMRGVEESVSFGPGARGSLGVAGLLSTLAGAIHEGQGVRLLYRAASGDTVRGFDPYGLAFIRGHGYVTGHCHLRRDIRSFRLDRILNLELLEWRFRRPASFDALAHLRRSISSLPRAFSIEVLLGTDLATASRRVMPELGILESDGTGVRMRSQADDLDWFARELAALPFKVTIRRPATLRTALRRHAGALLRTADARAETEAGTARTASVRRAGRSAKTSRRAASGSRGRE